MLVVPEVLGHGQAGEGHPHTGPGGLVHLAKDQGGLLNNAGLGHLPPQVVALAGALAHAGKDGIAAVLGGDVADKLLDQHGLAHAGASEQANLAALGVGGQQVDDLNARLQDLHRGALLGKARRVPVDGPLLLAIGRALVVDGVAQHVEHPAQGPLPHRHADGPAGGGDSHAAGKALAGGQGDAAHRAVAQML